MIRKSRYVIARWYPKHVFPYMTPEEIEQFWDSHRLSEDDWDGLTRLLLDQIFGYEFLTPYEENNNIFALYTKHPDSRRYAKELWPPLFSSKPVENLQLDRSEFEKIKPKFIAPKVKISDLFEPSRIVQLTFHPWNFGQKAKIITEEQE